MNQIYFDNGATSFPKAPGVGEAVMKYITECGGNVNRGVYQKASSAAETVLETREQLAALLGFKGDIRQVVFTPGITFALNQIIRGYLHSGDHVIVSSLEHNAVMRPLNELSGYGIRFSRIPAGINGITDPYSINNLICDNTKLVIVSHASNVCGALFPLEEVARICADNGIPLVVDAAQTAGHISIDFDKLGLAALCVPGHKGLLGPQGVGAMLLNKNFSEKIRPIVTGGTGSASNSEMQPSYMPDKFESGTMNLPGIFGLNASLTYISRRGTESLRIHEKNLTQCFIDGVKDISGVRIAGPADAEKQAGVVSLDFASVDNAEAAFILDTEYGISTRCGLHCAPNAHKTLGTFPQGTVRFSFGYTNTENEVYEAVKAVAEISKRQ